MANSLNMTNKEAGMMNMIITIIKMGSRIFLLHKAFYLKKKKLIKMIAIPVIIKMIC